MSFSIHTHGASAFATRGSQERNAHERRHAPHGLSERRALAACSDASELSFSMQATAAMRETHVFQARLNESLTFLQTQDTALSQIELLLEEGYAGENAACSKDSLEAIRSLAEEKFNGLSLFSRENGEQALYVQPSESDESICIQRPLMDVENPDSSLHQMLLEAREENHREQAQVCQLLDSTTGTHSSGKNGEGKIFNATSAKEIADLSQKFVLSEASRVLSLQTHSAHASALRLFL